MDAVLYLSGPCFRVCVRSGPFHEIGSTTYTHTCTDMLAPHAGPHTHTHTRSHAHTTYRLTHTYTHIHSHAHTTYRLTHPYILDCCKHTHPHVQLNTLLLTLLVPVKVLWHSLRRLSPYITLPNQATVTYCSARKDQCTGACRLKDAPVGENLAFLHMIHS